MQKLLVVDGSNLLFQMFYGMPSRILNRQGKPIQGTLGFVGALLKIIRMTAPTHVAVLFDGEYMDFRRELDPAYKANRTDYSTVPVEDTPFSQLPDLYRALDHLGICHAETTDCEADDWIAGYAAAYGGKMDVVIVSQDSDLFQLIGDRVTVLRYRGRQSVLWDRAYLRQKLGIGPEQYAAFKSLTGDPSDNIRGAEKVGPKTAAALLDQFGDLETLLQRSEEIVKPSIRRSIQESRERLRKNYELILLKGTQPLPFRREELAFRDSGHKTMEVLEKTGIL